MAFATGIPAKVRAVRLFVRDAVCAMLDQLGVCTESMKYSDAVIDSSSVSLKETMVGATTHAALSPSTRPLASSMSRSSWAEERERLQSNKHVP